MKKHNTIIIGILAATISTTSALAQFKPPENWVGPNWDSTGTQYESVKTGEGVYALVTNTRMATNSGFVVGDSGVLVIDPGLTSDTVNRIKQAVRAVTDKPIKYLVNTVNHGDHSFGNGFFGPETVLIQHSETAKEIGQKQLDFTRFLLSQRGDPTILDDIVIRKADITFENTMILDLGSISVELHHFGHGSSAGDTIIYVPSTKTVFTGNMVFGQDSIAWATSGKLDEYKQTLQKLNMLDIEFLVSGHSGTGDKSLIDRNIAYLDSTTRDIDVAIAKNLTLEQAYDSVALDSSYLPAPGSTFADNARFVQSAHRWNIKMRYLEKGKI